MSNVIQFPMDRIRSSSTVTFVDGTGPFVWYSTPSQTDQLEEQMNDLKLNKKYPGTLKSLKDKS